MIRSSGGVGRVEEEQRRKLERGGPRTRPHPAGRHAMRLLAALALLWSWAPAALADYVELQFDFATNSSLSLLGGTIVTPPDGTMDTGSARLQVEATGLTSMVAGGAVTLDQVGFSGTVAKNVAGVADISGPFSGSQVGSLGGTLNGTLDAASFAVDLILDFSAIFDCTGSGCAALGFPVNDVGLFPLNVSVLSITDLGVPGSARIEASVPIDIGGVQGVIDLVGIELSRALVPEPGTALLLGAGLAVFAAVRRRV